MSMEKVNLPGEGKQNGKRIHRIMPLKFQALC